MLQNVTYLTHPNTVNDVAKCDSLKVCRIFCILQTFAFSRRMCHAVSTDDLSEIWWAGNKQAKNQVNVTWTLNVLYVCLQLVISFHFPSILLATFVVLTLKVQRQKFNWLCIEFWLFFFPFLTFYLPKRSYFIIIFLNEIISWYYH